MSGETLEMEGTSIAITDPGDVDREHHRWPDRLMINVGNAAAWVFPLLMVGIVAQVFLRQSGVNQAWLDDAQWWMYGFAMLAGFGYAITTQSHVRVDILHQNYPEKKKARIEVFSIGWLLLPFLLIMTDILLHYAYASIIANEGSSSPNGLHKLYLLKSTLPVLFVVAIIAAWGVFRRNLQKFSSLALYKQLLWMFPAAVFFFTRITHYVMYWYVALTDPEINPRRITREDIFEYTGWIAFGIVVILFLISYLRSRNSSQEA